MKGYTPVSVVIADNREEAEQRFFVNWRPATRKAKLAASSIPSTAAEPAPRPRNPMSSDVIGSFPQPEPPR